MAGHDRPVPEGWKQILLVGCLSIFGPLCIDMYLPAFPRIGHDLHAGASAVQLSLTACLAGISLGQLLIGPVSDRTGRRPPLLAGLSAFVLASIGCAIAPDIYALVGFRLLQGLGGAAGVVISRSVVRDLHEGVALVRFFSRLMLATGLGPIIAPQLGSTIENALGWRAIFLGLAVLGAALLAAVYLLLPETLPPQRRSGQGASTSLSLAGSVCRDRFFLGAALACGFAAGAAFAYVAGSSFLLQDVYGLSSTLFGALFAVNAVGMIAGAQLNGRLAHRFSAAHLLTAGLLAMAASGAVLTIDVVLHADLPLVVMALLGFMFGWGFVGPNAVSLALHNFPGAAGTAAALLGAWQFLLSAAVAPLAGLGGSHDALPMALLVMLLPLAALACRALFIRVDGGPTELDETLTVAAPVILEAG